MAGFRNTPAYALKSLNSVFTEEKRAEVHVTMGLGSGILYCVPIVRNFTLVISLSEVP